MIYADSSFLVSCYILDANTSRAKAYLLATNDSIAWTSLHALEIRNAFELGTFRGLFKLVDITIAWRNLQTDLKNNRLVRSRVAWSAAFRSATRLSKQHSARTGARSLDVLHIAAAKSLGLTQFVSFDMRQRAMAAVAGLRVAP